MKKYIKYKGDYLVSDCGEVWRITNNGLKTKKTRTDKDGYIVTTINGGNEKVHRIVMEAFVGKSELQVDHLNMIKDDNRLSNLEYVTSKENVTRAKGTKVKWNNLIFESFSELGRHAGVSKAAPRMSFIRGKKFKGFYVERIIND